MKTHLITLFSILFLIGIANLSYSQVYKFKAVRVVVYMTGQNTADKPSDVLIVLNNNEKKITIYGNPTQYFDYAKIVDFDLGEGKKGDTYLCVDEEGEELLIHFIMDADGYLSVMLQYEGMIINFDVNLL
jgi:hypothetical protein